MKQIDLQLQNLTHIYQRNNPNFASLNAQDLGLGMLWIINKAPFVKIMQFHKSLTTQSSRQEQWVLWSEVLYYFFKLKAMSL